MLFSVPVGKIRHCSHVYEDRDIVDDAVYTGAVYGGGNYVVVGQGGSTIYAKVSTDDGASFQDADVTGVPAGAFAAKLIYDGSAFVGFGNGFSFGARSDDGGLTFYSQNCPGLLAHQNSVTIGENGRIIQTGGFASAGTCRYSDNHGASYTTVALTATPADFNNALQCAYGNGIVVALQGTPGSASDKFCYSLDNGVSWIASTLPVSQVWRIVIFNGKYFAAFARNSTTWIRSYDGLNWDALTTLTDVGSFNWHTGKGTPDGHFMLLALDIPDGCVCSCDDGASWEQLTFNTTTNGKGNALQDIGYGNNKFITARGSATGAAHRLNISHPI